MTMYVVDKNRYIHNISRKAKFNLILYFCFGAHLT